jgi:hypothetical protein
LERVERGGALVARFGDAFVGCGSLGQGVGSVDREPGVEGAVLALRDGQVSLGQGLGRDLTTPQQGGHLVRAQASQVIHWLRAPLAAAKDRRHD